MPDLRLLLGVLLPAPSSLGRCVGGAVCFRYRNEVIFYPTTRPNLSQYRYIPLLNDFTRFNVIFYLLILGDDRG